MNGWVANAFFNLAFALGAYTLLSLFYNFLCFIWRQCFRGQADLYSKYGVKGDHKSWAVVTGGSDGIGLEMCKNLARQGFNICIVARNEAKMKEKLSEI